MWENKKLQYLIIATVLFALLAGVLQFLHLKSETTVEEVTTEYTTLFDPTMETEFVKQLKNRQNNRLGSDLEY